MPFNKDLFIPTARTLVAAKIPFVHQGRNPALGLDCVGVITWSLGQCGYVPRDPVAWAVNDYKFSFPDPQALLDVCTSEADPVDIDAVQPGDIFAMTIGQRSVPQHVAIVSAIVSGVPYIIHTHETLGRVAEHWLDPEHRSHVWAAYRLKDFANG